MLSLLVEISAFAPHSGRVWGPMYDIFSWTPALEVSNSAGHKGDDVSVEAIAQTNPDWLFVLDRDPQHLMQLSQLQLRMLFLNHQLFKTQLLFLKTSCLCTRRYLHK